MPEVAGKSVTLRKTLPAADWWELYPAITKIKTGDQLMEKLDFPTAVKIAIAGIESWEFDGDPSDPEAYRALNFPDMVDLVRLAFNNAVSILNREDQSLGE